MDDVRNHQVDERVVIYSQTMVFLGLALQSGIQHPGPLPCGLFSPFGSPNLRPRDSQFFYLPQSSPALVGLLDGLAGVEVGNLGWSCSRFVVALRMMKPAEQ